MNGGSHFPYPSWSSVQKYLTDSGSDGPKILVDQDSLLKVLRAFHRALPFSAERYRELHPNFDLVNGPNHWFEYGYVQGWTLVGWEQWSWNVEMELLSAPIEYFTHMGRAADAISKGKFGLALKHFDLAISGWMFPITALHQKAEIFHMLRLDTKALDCLRGVLAFDSSHRRANELCSKISRDFSDLIGALRYRMIPQQHDIDFADILTVLGIYGAKTARKLLSTAQGHWVLGETVEKIVAQRIDSARNTIKVFRRNLTDTASSLESNMDVIRALVDLGFVKMASRLIRKNGHDIIRHALRHVAYGGNTEWLVDFIFATQDESFCDTVRSLAADDENMTVRYFADLSYRGHRGLLDESFHFESSDFVAITHSDTHRRCMFQMIRSRKPEDAFKLIHEFRLRGIYDSWMPGVGLCGMIETGLLQVTTHPRDHIGLLFSKSRTRIPRKIFQFWDKDPPTEVSSAMGSWKERNGDFEYVAFDLETAETFLADEYGDRCLTLFRSAIHPAMQCDFLRLAYLNKFGGFYVDADLTADNGLAILLDEMAGASCIITISPDGFFVHNDFMAFTPGHPILARALELSTAILERAFVQGDRIDIWNMTGPGLVSRAAFDVFFQRFESNQPVLGDDILALFSIRSRFARTHEFNYKTQTGGSWEKV